MNGTINVFLMYTSDDSTNLLQLLRHLDPIKKVSKVHFWYDDPIDPGKEWSPQIVSRFEDADVYILLVSTNFMYSKFIEQVEFKMIIDKYKAGKSKVLPIILEPCPWDIDFESDEYTFSFKELQVLPDVEKPIKNWESADKAFRYSAVHIKKEITSLTGRDTEKLTKKELGQGSTDEIQDQLALSFSGDKKTTEETKEENEVKETVFGQEKAIEGKNALLEDQPRRVLGEEQKHKEATEAKNKAEKEKRLEMVMESQRRIKEEELLKESTETNLEIQVIAKPEPVEKPSAKGEAPVQKSKWNSRKKTLMGMSSAAIIALAVILYARGVDASSDELIQQPQQDSVIANTSSIKNQAIDKNVPKTSTIGAGASLSKVSVGDRYGDGIIFKVKNNGENGVMAYTKDFRPMTWKEAMTIHEQLGDGWRLPTLEELSILYKTIGPGAENVGEFTDEFYWSATAYDQNQARLVRFSDGNTSYHYNSRGTHRKFLMRAVRDF
jgi:hypothetical protein